MSYGINENGEPWGFSDVRDWFEGVVLSFPAPWRLAPLDGKYYGTTILDGRGIPVLSFWRSEGELSYRERAKNPDCTTADWKEYCSDSHWESQLCLETAQAVIAARNSTDKRPDADARLAFHLIFTCGRWAESVWPEISFGGPNRRAIQQGGAR
jgi:hypothetical protein